MSLLDDVSIVVTPNGYKAGELYAVIPVPTEGAELLTNGDFANGDTGWSNGGTTSFSNSQVTITGVSYIVQSNLLTIGKNYKLTINVDSINTNSGTVIAALGSGSDPAKQSLDQAGNLTFYFYDITFGSNWIQIFTTSDATVTVNSISVKEYTSADMDVTRATAATRVDEDGLVNYAEVLGGEEVTNGDFATDLSGWSFGGTSAANTIVWNNGRADMTADGTTALLLAQGVFEVGKTYRIELDAYNITGAGFKIYDGGNVLVIQSDGHHTVYHTALSTSLNIYRYQSGAASSGEFDNISVKEVTRDNVPRIDYTGGGCPHILAEPQRTNLITYSEDFSQSSWASSNISSGISTVLSPDGTTFSYKLTNDAASGFHFVRDNSTVTSGVPYTLSVFIKKGTRDIVSIADGFNVNVLANFDLTNGTSTNISATSSSIESLNNDWYKCIATITPTTTTLGLMLFSGTVYAGQDESGYFYVWGGQVENGSYATSYIPTSGSTVTRNQDIFTRDGIGSLINDTEGVLFVEMAALVNADATNPNRGLGISSGSTNNTIFIYFQASTNQLSFILISGGTTQFSGSTTSFDVTSFNKIALKYKANDFALWINGTEIATDTSGTAPTGLSELRFDNGAGNDKLFGKVRQLQVYDTALTDTQLAALTS